MAELRFTFTFCMMSSIKCTETSLIPEHYARPLHHLQSFSYGLDVLLGFEPEGGDGMTARVMRLRRIYRRQLWGGGGLNTGRCVGCGHNGRREVAGVAGLWVREEAGQRTDERRCEPRVNGQCQARPRGAPQRPYGVVVIEPQPRRFHLLLTSPLRAPVLEPYLHIEGRIKQQILSILLKEQLNTG